MSLNVAINGFGRIGRNVLRAIVERDVQDIKVVAINNVASLETSLHLFKYDTIHGIFKGEISSSQDEINIGLGPIKIFSERNIKNLDWKSQNVDIVFECTGKFNDKVNSINHIQNGAKKVIISAPGKNADITVVFGVNHKLIKKEHKIISCASCTTNCLAPVLKILNDNIGIKNGFVTTIHSFTGDQSIVDRNHKDLFRARAAGQNIIPTTTGSANSIGLIMPELKGKLDGISVRVPNSNVSLIDLTLNLVNESSLKEVNQLFIEFSKKEEFKNILSTNDLPLVSSDFNHNVHSAIFDLNQTKLIDKKLLRTMAWYDNEWGFSNRMIDTALYISSKKC